VATTLSPKPFARIQSFVFPTGAVSA
jgi:hypothetical protein